MYSALAEREHKTRGRVKISGSRKDLCSKKDFSKTIDWAQGRQYPKGNALNLEGKIVPMSIELTDFEQEAFLWRKNTDCSGA